MREAATGTEKLRAVLVLAATAGMIAFNWLAANGHVNGVTPAMISDKYPTSITPAGYAFAIWGFIYLGMSAFSIYQILPSNILRFSPIRSLYITSCALNCAWIYFWHHEQIAICLAVIAGLLTVLLLIVTKLRRFDSFADSAIAKLPFGLYAGWVTAASLVNFAVLLSYLNIESGSPLLSVVLILIAAAMGVLIRIKLSNYFYPLAIAWALTAIAVNQSGDTPIVIAAAVGVIACLIASLSFVMNMNKSAQ